MIEFQKPLSSGSASPNKAFTTYQVQSAHANIKVLRFDNDLIQNLCSSPTSMANFLTHNCHHQFIFNRSPYNHFIVSLMHETCVHAKFRNPLWHTSLFHFSLQPLCIINSIDLAVNPTAKNNDGLRKCDLWRNWTRIWTIAARHGSRMLFTRLWNVSFPQRDKNLS